MELIVIAVVIGVVVLAAWPLAAVLRRDRSPLDQPQVTDTERVPPPDPAAPIPGSRAHRRRQGKP
jgi:hypothetical protein